MGIFMFVSRLPARSSAARRRAAQAFVVPVAVVGLLGVGSPAVAATTPPDGICNGVVNQLAHRGTVQPNLLKAAARKNAELITKLQASKAGLESQATMLNKQITDAKAAIAALEAENLQLDKDIVAAQTELAAFEAEQTRLTGAVATAEQAIVNLNAQKAGLQDELAPLQEQLLANQGQAA